MFGGQASGLGREESVSTKCKGRGCPSDWIWATCSCRCLPACLRVLQSPTEVLLAVLESKPASAPTTFMTPPCKVPPPPSPLLQARTLRVQQASFRASPFQLPQSMRA